MARTCATLFILAAAGIFSAEAISGTQKVIALLGDMAAKAKHMKNEEAVGFSKFNQFCDNKQASTAKDIKVAAELMESLSADIGKLGSDIKGLGESIDQLNNEVTTDNSELKEAKDQREKDHASYTEQIEDMGESVDALERAIAVMKKRNFDSKQAASALLQLTTSNALPEKVQRTVTAYLEMSTGEEGLLPASPEANAYEFQSGGIVELLEKLHDEFSTKKGEAEKEEMNSKHAHQMVSQDLHDSIENAESDISTKTGIKQSKIELKAKNTKELGVTTNGHATDSKYLSELKTECFEKKESFKEKQDLRTEEIAAIGKAMEILKSPDVAGNAEKNLPSALMQSGTSFAQLRATQEQPGFTSAAARFLRSAGMRLHSQRLGMIAEKISVGSNPFGKVKKMIDEMITKLLEETNKESEQKGFCDKELGTNAQTRTKQQGTIDELTAKIDEGEASIVSATQRISELSKELAELSDSVKQATSLRQEEKAKNAETVKDSQEANKAIEAATAVLKDFYEKASLSTALLQDGAGRPTMGSQEWASLANPNFEGQVDKGHKKGMQTFGKTYSGMQDEAGGVFAMLEVIASDFSSLEADTKASEASAAKTYSEFMTESKQATAVKNKESQMLTDDRTQAESDKLADTKDLKATQDQLLASNRYYDKLKPTCVDSGISYGDRVKAREQEIQSLKEALQILQGQ